MNTSLSDLDLLMEACREERDRLPSGKRTTGEAIHGLVIEVVGQLIQAAAKKKTLVEGNNG